MKIQSLAVISIILILPISILLSSYIKNEVTTLNYQISYDSKLQNATYDALKAFQLNSSNSDTSDMVNPKMRDIKAAANTFFNSLSSNFNMSGYNKDVLKNYVPALVFTMYDGYYIYAPYTNTLSFADDKYNSNPTYGKDEEITGLKPYVYYSCRYIKDSLDVVITYSLDNYITVQGKKGTEIINDSGYLLTDVNVNVSDGTVKYREIEIKPETGINAETGINENIMVDMEQNDNFGRLKFPCKEVNGVKYYLHPTYGVFSMFNGKPNNRNVVVTREDITSNTNAVDYYKDACEFRGRLDGYGILDLKVSDAVNENGVKICDQDGDNGEKVWSANKNDKIFEGIDGGTTAIEEPTSNFNQHRLQVIRYCIEKNLSVAINNFNTYSTSSTNFLMPKLKETDWDKILDNISIISFMQGLSIGGKIYNGYSVVPNTENKEVITEDSIYIMTTDKVAHKVTEKGLENATNIERGTAKKNVIRSSTENKATGETHYFFRYPGNVSYSYESIVAPNKVVNLENYSNGIYDYLKGKDNLAKIYYTALGRERKGMYRPANSY